MILGIDPGASGGLAWVGGLSIAVLRMPKTESDIFNAIHDGADFAFIEQVHSMPGQGVASSFKFGMNYGGLRMALIAAGIPFETVTPQKWMGYFGLRKKKNESKVKWKNRLKAKAQELFPEIKMTLAICDALLIAEYGRRIRA